ncbi:hypothetical protein BC567DRAFT_54248 [Phyllosticta citribraziliensis]
MLCLAIIVLLLHATDHCRRASHPSSHGHPQPSSCRLPSPPAFAGQDEATLHSYSCLSRALLAAPPSLAPFARPRPPRPACLFCSSPISIHPFGQSAGAVLGEKRLSERRRTIGWMQFLALGRVLGTRRRCWLAALFVWFD